MNTTAHSMPGLPHARPTPLASELNDLLEQMSVSEDLAPCSCKSKRKGTRPPTALSFRMTQAEDQALMEQLFRSSRHYLYSLPLPDRQIDNLLAHQYQLQQASYAKQAPDAYTLTIQSSGKAIGKISLDEGDTAVHIIDLALWPDQRGKGFGTSVLKAIQAHAQKRQVPVVLSIDRQNLAARKLYLRLGFQPTGMSDTHEAMNWWP